jgi:FkbM family methyltransferase
MRHDDLIIDVGMHDGEDTARFLAAGYRVVAIEADARLVAAAQTRFAAEIDGDRLTLVEAAVSGERGTARFGLADDTIWSSLAPEMIARNERVGASYEYVEVQTIPFEDVLAEHGVPHYLKIDIEGYDILCVRALASQPDRPRYVSLETAASALRAPADAVFDEFAVLWTLGYRRFRYAEQAGSDNAAPRNGEWPGGSWHTAWGALAQAQVLRGYHNFAGLGGRFSASIPARAYRRTLRTLNRQMPWYDLHAALPDES